MIEGPAPAPAPALAPANCTWTDSCIAVLADTGTMGD